jgi:hypothetical protein
VGELRTLTSDSARLEIDQRGKPRATRNNLSTEEVSLIIRQFDGDPDTTLLISRQDLDGHIMLAVSEHNWFAALDSSKGLFEFALSNDPSNETVRFSIGGQDANISRRRVLSAEEAVRVVTDWLINTDSCVVGFWEQT